MVRPLGMLVLAMLSGLGAQADATVSLLGHQVLQGDDRASMLFAVRNDSQREIQIERIAVDGRSLEQLTQRQGRHKIGKTLDWYDIRPRQVKPGQATTVLLGYARMDWLVDRPVIELVLESGDRLPIRLPELAAQPLAVAAAGFSDDLEHLTLLVRNDSPVPVEVNRILFNGEPIEFNAATRTMAPGRLTHLDSVVHDVDFGTDCSVVIDSSAGQSAAWITARPAESLTYMFYSRWCDPRDLAEKNIAVGNSHLEANAEFARQLDEHNLEWPDRLANTLRQRVEHFVEQPNAWAWYVQDDAGWGHPTPSALIAIRRFIRRHGSKHPQIICNPADNLRYAWVGDVVMNYSYHVTHQTPDPTQFTGGRSLERVRRLNEPAPVTYLVDTVGQGVRWITVAEEELASYAILGRGARHLGWFLGPSMWEQGGQYGGATDPFDTQPWRYQEGMTANTEIGNHVRRIAATFTALSEHIAVSAPLPGHLTDSGVEVLPSYAAADRMVITALLNRRLRCTYPRNFDDKPMASGGIRLEPQHDFTVEIPRPSWTEPHAVMAFDHDRGMRSLPFEVEGQHVLVKVDSLPATALLFTVDSPAVVAELRNALKSIEPAVGGSPIRPDISLAADTIGAQGWLAVDAPYRTSAEVAEPLAAGAWLLVDLPIDKLEPWGPSGFFSPDSVTAYIQGREMPLRVDSGRLLTDQRGHARWTAANRDDDRLSIQPGESGIAIKADHDDGYAVVRAELEFDPSYPLLDIEHRIEGRIAPLLRYEIVHGSEKHSGAANLYSDLDRWQYWPRSRRIVDPRSGQLATTRIDLRQVIAAKEKLDPDGNWRIVAMSLDAQVYWGEFRFGRIIQRPYVPRAMLHVPEDSQAGKTRTCQVYWDYQDTPAVPSRGTWRPSRPKVLAAGGVELAMGQALSVDRSEHQINQVRFRPSASVDTVWLEQRDDRGRLVSRTDLQAGAGAYALREPVALPADAAAVALWTARRNGPTVRIDLLDTWPKPLEPFARVEGQVESIDLSVAGQWLIVGAAGVTAVDLAGGTLWSKDLGTNRRQPQRYGPGRNVARVGIDSTTGHAYAWTFAFDEKNKRWDDALLVVWDPTGREKYRRQTDWRVQPVLTRDCELWFGPADGSKQARLLDLSSGQIRGTDSSAERAAVLTGQPWLEYIGAGWPPRLSQVRTDDRVLYEVTWPAYALHREVLPDGSLVTATTQGHLHCLDADGRPRWNVTRPSRIEALVPFAERGVIAIARKDHFNNYDWQARPVVELIDLQTGRLIQSHHGQANDDYGHLGTDLSLAGDQQRGVLVMGDWAGCLYRIDLD